MDFRIELLGDGALLGFTFFGKDDRIEAYEEEDWNELNIYLVIAKLTWRWW